MTYINNRIIYSILFYILVIVLIIVSKPNIVFDENQHIRQFGFGDNKTLFSLGVFTVVLALLSYYIFALIDVLFENK